MKIHLIILILILTISAYAQIAKTENVAISWESIKVKKKCSFPLPSVLEIQSQKYFDVTKKYGVFEYPKITKRIILQQKGLNDIIQKKISKASDI